MLGKLECKWGGRWGYAENRLNETTGDCSGRKGNQK